MSDLRELYQDVIIDHSKRPRNFKLEARTGLLKGTIRCVATNSRSSYNWKVR